MSPEWPYSMMTSPREPSLDTCPPSNQGVADSSTRGRCQSSRNRCRPDVCHLDASRFFCPLHLSDTHTSELFTCEARRPTHGHTHMDSQNSRRHHTVYNRDVPFDE